jgi:hypothetical protein
VETDAQQESICLHHPFDHTKSRTLTASELSKIEPLLEDMLIDGKLVYELPTLQQIRETREKTWRISIRVSNVWSCPIISCFVIAKAMGPEAYLDAANCQRRSMIR